MNDEIEGKEKIVYLPIFVGVGVGMGFFLGSIIFDDRLISMGIGITVGAIIGGVLDYIKNKK